MQNAQFICGFTEVGLSDSLKVDAQTILTGRGCAIGQSGSGKSFLIGVIAEELCRTGMPFCVVDTEGEYSSLKSLFNVIVVGGSNKDVDVNVDFTRLFRASIENSIPIVLDVSDVIDRTELVYRAITALYNLEDKIRKPYLLMVEEADRFAPQVVGKKINIIEEISVRGRKRGMGLFIATQRPANISKNVLAQCSYGFIGKLTIENDIDAIRILFADRRKLNEITALNVGEFMPFGTSYTSRFMVKERAARHMGSTPIVDASHPARIKINEIIRSLGKSRPKVENEIETKESSFVDVLHGSISMSEAREYAETLSKKQFIVFGQSTEKIESVALEYLPLGLFRLRIPTKRLNEYLEHYALVTSNGELLKIGKSVEFVKSPAPRAIPLSKTETAILARVLSAPRISIDKIREDFEDKELRRAIRKLQQSSLINDDNGRLTVNNYASSLLEQKPRLDKSKIVKEKLMGSGIDKKQAEAYVGNFFPGSITTSFIEVYMPMYKITLRSGNRVRVFAINAIDGRQISV